jgi:hypothetical protein
MMPKYSPALISAATATVVTNLDFQFFASVNEAQEEQTLVSVAAVGLGESTAQDHKLKKKTKLHGLSPQANCSDRGTAACRRS